MTLELSDAKKVDKSLDLVGDAAGGMWDIEGGDSMTWEVQSAA